MMSSYVLVTQRPCARVVLCTLAVLQSAMKPITAHHS